MKYCERYAALLDAFVDGECSPPEEAEIRAHLAECPGCAAYVADALAIRDAFPGLDDVEAAEGLADSVCAAVRAAPRRKRQPWLKTAVSLAACFAVLAAGAAVVLPDMMPGGSNSSGASDIPAAAAPAPAPAAPAAPAASPPATPEVPECANVSQGEGEDGASLFDYDLQSNAPAEPAGESSPAGSPQSAALPAEGADDSLWKHGDGARMETAKDVAPSSMAVPDATACAKTAVFTAGEAGSALDGLDFQTVREGDIVIARYTLEEADFDAVITALDAWNRVEEDGGTLFRIDVIQN